MPAPAGFLLQHLDPMAKKRRTAPNPAANARPAGGSELSAVAPDDSAGSKNGTKNSGNGKEADQEDDEENLRNAHGDDGIPGFGQPVEKR